MGFNRIFYGELVQIELNPYGFELCRRRLVKAYPDEGRVIARRLEGVFQWQNSLAAVTVRVYGTVDDHV